MLRNRCKKIENYLVDSAEGAVSEDPAPAQFSLFDDPQFGQIGFNVTGTQRFAVLVAAHDHRHFGRVLLGLCALVPVVAETGQEDAQQGDAADDAAQDGGNVLVVAVVQRVGHRLLGAVRIAAVAREDLVRGLRGTVGRAVELRRVVHGFSR